MNIYHLTLLSVPLISALIGWLTNFIAIKMLFYPRKKKSFLFFSLHGVFPKRQSELALKLGQLFAEHLGIQDKIHESIKTSLKSEKATQELQLKIKDLAFHYIKTEVPFLASMIPNELIDNLSVKVANELEIYFKNKLSSEVNNLSTFIDVKSLVQNQIEELNVEELEHLLQNLLRKEFRFIEFCGAFLGFTIGFIQLFITLLLFKNIY